jgi:hypothetical protein
MNNLKDLQAYNWQQHLIEQRLATLKSNPSYLISILIMGVLLALLSLTVIDEVKAYVVTFSLVSIFMIAALSVIARRAWDKWKRVKDASNPTTPENVSPQLYKFIAFDGAFWTINYLLYSLILQIAVAYLPFMLGKFGARSGTLTLVCVTTAVSLLSIFSVPAALKREIGKSPTDTIDLFPIWLENLLAAYNRSFKAKVLIYLILISIGAVLVRFGPLRILVATALFIAAALPLYLAIYSLFKLPLALRKQE